VTEEEIKARFEDGILKLSIPKKVEKPEDTRRVISIQ
jgi:HSP20 family molecular chaperone IbpA